MPQVRTFDEKVAAIEARNQQADTYRICPRCGAETFTQQPVRSKPPG
jgi:hypothetical protein